MKNHSEKASPASKPSTQSMLRAGLDRAGKPDHADAPIKADNTYATSDKLTRQSAGARRRGETQYADRPDKPMPRDHESTGSNWAGSKPGSR
jgi:hypothetical protein